MRLLMIAVGYLPYTFSEGLCNGKLVFAMAKEGWQVDVITKVDNGTTYSTQWTEPWLPLKDNTQLIEYPLGGKIARACDVLHGALTLNTYPEEGIRWAYRAYKLALKLCREHSYDAVLTRSPSDIPHLVGLRLKERLGIRWIANWNDPAAPIWPEPYKHNFSQRVQDRKERLTIKCLKEADINTFPSQSLLNHFTLHYPFLSQHHTAVIPHIALHLSIYPIAKEIPKTKCFQMCHSGNLSFERNPELTFKAISELVDEGYTKICFSIMGHINDYTQSLINEYHLEQYVKCIGSFSYMDAIRKMQEFDCLVLLEAQLKEGIFFASKFTDYAQIGKPILAISPSKGFAADILSQYGGGVSVDNEDYHSIKSGILTLYQAWEKGTLYSQYSTKRLYQQVSAKRVIELYNDLLN